MLPLHHQPMQSRKDLNLEPRSQSPIRCQLHHRTIVPTFGFEPKPLLTLHRFRLGPLPFGLSRQVEVGGLEPPISCLSDRRTNQLYYTSIQYLPTNHSSTIWASSCIMPNSNITIWAISAPTTISHLWHIILTVYFFNITSSYPFNCFTQGDKSIVHIIPFHQSSRIKISSSFFRPCSRSNCKNFSIT